MAKYAQAKISQKTFENLCAIQCTREEICGVLGVSDDTLLRWCKNKYGTDFATIYKQKRLGGCASLRRRQWDLASVNPTMLIFLGKQYLGQKDVVETDNKHELVKVEELLNKIEQEANR